MNIRINAATDGIIRYFQEGKKNQKRDEWDDRIICHGDLDTLQSEIDFINTQLHYKQAYKHVTFGISPQDAKWFIVLSDEEKKKRINALAKDWLKLYVPQYEDDIDSLTYHLEIHMPKKGKEFKADGTPRWPHAHLALSLLDKKRGKQLQVMSFNEEGDLAKQTELALKHGFVISKEFARDKDREKPFISNRSDACKYIAQQIKGVANVPELRFALGQLPELEIVKENVGGLGYFKTKFTTDNGKSFTINIKGGDFEFLSEIYAQHKGITLDKDRYTTKAGREHRIMYDADFRRKVIYENEMRHLDKVTSKKEANKRWLKDYDFWVRELDKRLSDVTRQERNFYMIYGCNLKGEVLGNTSIFKDKKIPNAKVLHNKDHNFFLVDTTDKITCRNGLSTDEKRLAAAILMIETGIKAHGWKLEEIEFFGDEEFKAIAYKELQRRIDERGLGVKSAVSSFFKKLKAEVVSTVRLYSRSTNYPNNEEDSRRYSKVQKVKAKTNHIKQNINPSELLNRLETLGADVSHVKFHTKSVKNGATEIRFKFNERNLNAIDFTRQALNCSLDDAIKITFESSSAVKSNEFKDQLSREMYEHEIDKRTSKDKRSKRITTPLPRQKPNKPTNDAPSI
ncbi:TPA: hypothetical protein I7171_21180 [Vibrio vulnificus]|nr:hypothetical protein [Vibrio vulnificus]